MKFAPIRRFVIAALVVACVGCGGGGDKSDDAADEGTGSASISTTTAPTAATDPGTPSSSSDTAGAPAGPTSSEPDNAQPSDTQPDPNSPDPGGGGTGFGPPEPVLTGTYRYKQAGQTKSTLGTIPTPPEGTLLVDPATPDGTQVSHRRINPQQPPSDTTIRYGPDGMYLMSTTMRAQGMEVTCTFGDGIATPPWPPTVGAPISGQGSCGKTSATVTGSITGTDTYTLDGAAVDVFVVKTTIVTSGDLVATINITAWFAPSLRLVVHDETNQQGKYLGIEFSGWSTSDLLSGAPT